MPARVPSKGGSRTTATASTPSALARGRAGLGIGMEWLAPCIGRSGSPSAIADEPRSTARLVPELEEDPATDSPEWADLYARALAHRRESANASIAIAARHSSSGTSSSAPRARRCRKASARWSPTTSYTGSSSASPAPQRRLSTSGRT